jgi:hypothetical protein
MLQVFHGRQGPSKPREGKADRDRRHVGGDRHGKQCKKSVYMGKEEVWRGIG